MIILETPIGKLGIECDQSHLVRIDFLYDKKIINSAISSPFGKEVLAQLQSYFHKNSQQAWNIPCRLAVTPFQKRVLVEIAKIPAGETRSYGALAKVIGTSPRAVGNACRNNPIPVVIPCHRVVAEKHLGGFSGERDGKALMIKRWLLQHEGWL